jgi:hypothetical protein
MFLKKKSYMRKMGFLTRNFRYSQLSQMQFWTFLAEILPILLFFKRMHLSVELWNFRQKGSIRTEGEMTVFAPD